MSRNLQKFLHQSSHYSIAQVVMLLASLISFPILTRLFTPAEYGIMNLISNTIVIVLALSKAGVQHGVVRFYHEYSGREQEGAAQQFASSLLWGGLGLALLISLLWLAGNLVLGYLIEDPLYYHLLLLSSALIFLRAGESLLLAFLRAEQRTLRLNIYRVINRYGNLALILCLLLYYSRTLTAFYMAQIVTMVVSLAVLLVWRIREARPSLTAFQIGIFWPALLYSLPLVGFELGSALLQYLDRFMLQHFSGPDAVGYYSAVYNLTDYMKDIVVLPLGTAVVPIYMQIWAKKGAEATQRFLRQAMRSYLLLAIPLAFGCIAVKRELIIIAASEKFLLGQNLTPWLIAGLMLSGALPILAAGLYIEKKTLRLVGLLALSIAANALLNLFLIPLWGLDGAAVAKFLAFFLLAASAAHSSYRHIAFSIPWQSLLTYHVAGVLMFAALRYIDLNNILVVFATRVTCGALIYIAIVALLDAPFRQNTLAILRRLAVRA